MRKAVNTVNIVNIVNAVTTRPLCGLVAVKANVCEANVTPELMS